MAHKAIKGSYKLFKGNLQPIPNLTYLTNLVFQLHLLKGKFLADDLAQF